MYVRWQRYRSQARDSSWAKRNDSRALLKAILVESVRVDGKPRQKHVAFLGSIASDRLRKSGPAFSRFWYDVTSKLKRLSNRIGPEDYERIIVSIAAKVGGRAMTEDELERFEREREQFLGNRVGPVAGKSETVADL